MVITNAITVNSLSKYFKVSKREKKSRKSKGIQKTNDNIVRAVDNISFEVKEGEIFGFLGPNGAGKTTTIRTLTGVLTPTEGRINIFGEDIWEHPIPIKQVLGNVPEMANVYMDLTALQNLSFIGELYGIPKKDHLNRAEMLLKKFELFEKRHFKAKKFSKGMKQRLLLCMALMSNPKILFLDEPVSGLDVQSARVIKQLIKDYNKRGMTIFLTTHDMNVANELCDRIAIINKGHIIRLDTPDNLKKLTQDYLAIDCYFENAQPIKGIKNLRTVKEVQEIKGGYHIIVENVSEALYEIISHAKSNNLKIIQLNTHQPTLEDAFLRLIEGGGKN